MWDLLARFIVRKSVFILITILVGTAIVGYNSTEQRLQWSLPKMLPDNDSTLMAFNDFKDRFGNNGQALILALEENP
ncbi:MAG: putative RND superfamily exporter protein, partial [Dokdonia sp.]